MKYIVPIPLEAKDNKNGSKTLKIDDIFQKSISLLLGIQQREKYMVLISTEASIKVMKLMARGPGVQVIGWGFFVIQ